MNLPKLIPALCFALAFTIVGNVHAQRGRGVPGVVITKVKKESRILKQPFVGTVTPIRNAVVGSAVDGRVKEVLFQEGDYVAIPKEAGQANIRPAMVKLATKAIGIQIDAAKVELQLRQLAHEELSKSLPKEIELLEAQVAEAETQTELASSDFKRMENANKTNGAISLQELDTARSTFQKNKMSQIGLEIELRKLQQTKESKLKQSLAKISAQQEELKRLVDIQSKYTIRIPFEGYIVGKTTEVGHWVSKGEDVFQVVQADPIDVVINVPQSVVQKIHASLDQQGRDTKSGKKPVQSNVIANVYLESSETPLQGFIHSIVPQADLRSRSFPVKIRLSNPKTKNGHLLKSGMLTKVDITVGSPSSQLLVKKDALVLNGNRAHIVAVELTEEGKKGKTQVIPVTTGSSYSDWIEVKGDIRSGQWVVTEGNERLKSDQSVKIIQKQVPGE